MDIKTYIRRNPYRLRGKVRQMIAQAAGVTPTAVKHWENGLRNVPAKRAALVEAATNGQVTILEILFPERAITQLGNKSDATLIRSNHESEE